ncbi:MAG: sulfurtransferase TusA family protein [Rhodospirillales bacterium CG15_BIG_FIL_POST_REV_8_21_14_020_66_15]|nr:MAG: sulfurtransferase TusA family protein [Rhodospirillales bacterium CG15_BIG_FIL_POST_REV_8_21_14_020_66_15]
MGKPEETAGTSEIAHFLDITNDICPMTFVKTKLFLERLGPGALLEVRLKGPEPLGNVPRSVRDHGHEVLSLDPEDSAHPEPAAPHRLVIRKAS